MDMTGEIVMGIDDSIFIAGSFALADGAIDDIRHQPSDGEYQYSCNQYSFGVT